MARSLVLILTLSIFAGNLSRTSAEEPPNLVFILVDDLGWKDVGIHASLLCRTPQIDRLAAQGMQFTQAYAPAPICSASRAAFLTGRSPARLHFEFVTKHANSKQKLAGLPLHPPPFTFNLPLGEQTIPEVLKVVDYRSAFFGKWHVSMHHQRYLGWSPTHGPRQQGFNVAIEDFGGHTYSQSSKDRVPSDYKMGEYPPDSMTDRAIRFLEEQGKNGPFYLQVNHFYVHTPVRSQAEWITQKYVSQLGPDQPRRHAEYAAFVEILDHHVGRLLYALERLGLRDNTVVVLTSDNGGDPRYTRHAPLRGHKWTLYEGGIRVPLLIRWEGVTTPGKRCDLPVIGTDLLPTFAELAGAPLDSKLSLDGTSLVPLLRGQDDDIFQNRRLLWHFPYYHPEEKKPAAKRTVGINDTSIPFVEPHSAIREGRYKAIHFYERNVTELYDLEKDPSEKHDLSKSDPAKADAFHQKLQHDLSKVAARLPQPAVSRKPTP